MGLSTGFSEDLGTEVCRLLDAGEISAAGDLLAAHPPRNADEEFEHETLSGRAAASLSKFHEAWEHYLKGLRIGRRLSRSRVRIRTYLCHLLLNAGDLARAERELRRALTELRSKQWDLDLEPKLLSYLGSIYRRRGMLSFSIRTHEEAVRLARARGTRLWGGFAIPLANALLLHGELERTGEFLQELIAQPEVFSPSQHLYVRALVAVHALDVNDLDRADQVLAPIVGQLDGMEAARRITCLLCVTEVMLRRGHPDEALARLEAMGREVENEPALTFMASGVAIRVAEALHQLGRDDEALIETQKAIRLGRASDPVDWASGLKNCATYLAALGRMDEARTTLAEAHSILRASECRLEQRNLEETARSLGVSLEPADPIPPQGRAEVAPQAEPTWIPLRDGRAFLTVDPRLQFHLRRCAASDIPVLIEGETGTGKELVAHLIHELGARANGPLVVVDCATLSEGLAEAELFGVVRGAYTGAVADRPGLAESAEGGTLFFDELAELSPVLQGKLLRLLQEGTYRRLGDTRTRKVRMRIVAASNRNVEELVRQGEIKQDLFYRLKGHLVRLQPLRERPREIRLLADESARAAGLLGVSSGAHRRFVSHPWPGNVRELQMLIRVAASEVASGGWLDERALDSVEHDLPRSHPPPSLRVVRMETERESLKRALESSGGNVTEAARALGISRQAFYKAMRRAGVSKRDDVHFA